MSYKFYEDETQVAELVLIEGHFYVRLDGSDWLLDTGAPSSFGITQSIVINNKEFGLQRDYLGLDAKQLSMLTKHKIFGLIGVDILNQFYVVIDYENRQIAFSNKDIAMSGSALEMREFMGIPIVNVGIDGADKNLFFDTGAQIWGSLASADMNLDGVTDFVVGSKDKYLYFFDENGFSGSYNTESFLISTPVIGNIDDDPELEVLIGGYSGGDGRKIFALNHDQTPVSGFPIDIGEKIKKGISLADFNNNGKDDMVFGTDEDNIYLIYDDGTIADGFPYQTGGKIHSSPSILDIDGDLLILAGSNDNHLYAINADGTLKFSVETQDNVESSPAFLNYLNN